jgi:hypothetical protein
MPKVVVKVTAEDAAQMVGMPVGTLQRWRKTKPKLYKAVMEWCARKRFEEQMQ